MRNLGKRRDTTAYFRSAWTEDGRPVRNNEYATTRTVNDALRYIHEFEGASDETPAPWLVAVSFHAAHFPLHAPPDDLHSFELSGTPNQSALAHHRAMVEAIDREPRNNP